MGKKFAIIFEVIVIISISIYYVFKDVIPEYKSKMGSSDSFIKTSNYKNLLEFDIDSKVNFAVTINEEKKIYHLMFFCEEAVTLYNENIENTTIEDGLDRIVQILIENNYLKSNSMVKVTRYSDDYYREFFNVLKLVLTKYKLNTNIIEDSSSLFLKAESLKLDVLESDSDEAILRVLDNYSKEFPRTFKNSSKSRENTTLELDENNSKKFINNVYKKLEDYVKKNNITSLEKNDTELIISLIPADSELKYYPSNNSWYYVRDGKVYAYIEIIDNNISYSYCYNGSIDLNKKGAC